MNKKSHSKKKIIARFFLNWSGILTLPAITLLGLLIFSASPQVTETFYSRTVYPVITVVVTALFGWVPFSVTEIVLYGLLLSLLAGGILLLVRKVKFRSAIFALLTVLGLLFSWFYLSWGFNYFRQPLAVSLNLPQSPADSVLFRQFLMSEVQLANTIYVDTTRRAFQHIEQEVEARYAEIERELALNLPGGMRSPKHLILDIILDKTLTSGIFSPFFHEVHVNHALSEIEYPFILAHEKAHQMGIAIESEANFMAFLVCAGSDVPLLQYSAHFMILGNTLRRASHQLQDYPTFRKAIRPEIITDYQRVQMRWQKHVGKISEVSHEAYDRYLKANKIKEGVANYAGVIDLIAHYKQRRGELAARDGD